MKLGIVGHGFVGTAVDHGFTKDVQKFIVDPKHNSTNTIEDLIAFRPDATFVAVPTPQLETGECNTEILEGVMQQLNNSKGLLVIVKSTVPAYKLQSIIEQCVDLRIVYNPEFLTEKNYINDFINPPMHVFGGINADTDAVEKLYKEHSICKQCPVYKTDIVTASMVKYCINSFTDWQTFTKIIANDPRIGNTHMKVPGNDGQRGYAGSCFPKDTNALAWFAREILNTPFTQLETSIKINDTLRKKNQS